MLALKLPPSGEFAMKRVFPRILSKSGVAQSNLGTHREIRRSLESKTGRMKGVWKCSLSHPPLASNPRSECLRADELDRAIGGRSNSRLGSGRDDYWLVFGTTAIFYQPSTAKRGPALSYYREQRRRSRGRSPAWTIVPAYSGYALLSSLVLSYVDDPHLRCVCIIITSFHRVSRCYYRLEWSVAATRGQFPRWYADSKTIRLTRSSS